MTRGRRLVANVLPMGGGGGRREYAGINEIEVRDRAPDAATAGSFSQRLKPEVANEESTSHRAGAYRTASRGAVSRRNSAMGDLEPLDSPSSLFVSRPPDTSSTRSSPSSPAALLLSNCGGRRRGSSPRLLAYTCEPRPVSSDGSCRRVSFYARGRLRPTPTASHQSCAEVVGRGRSRGRLRPGARGTNPGGLRRSRSHPRLRAPLCRVV